MALNHMQDVKLRKRNRIESNAPLQLDRQVQENVDENLNLCASISKHEWKDKAWPAPTPAPAGASHSHTRDLFDLICHFNSQPFDVAAIPRRRNQNQVQSLES